MDATQAFTPAFDPSAPRAPQAALGVTRKVPQWVFLDTLFRDVILKDRVAMGVTGGGTRVNLLRRVLLATAAGLALIFSIGFLVSYIGNRQLQARLLDAAQTLKPATVAVGDLPTADVLRRLDKLREVVAELASYEDQGAPLDLRWGLYSGSRMFSDARRLYFGEFNKLMFRDTYGTMVRTMQTLPSTPTEGTEYQSNYNLLKAYLITSAYPKESTTEFLPPVLQKYWADGRNIDDERQQTAAKQFTFYSTELKRANPIELSPDSAVVEHTRSFLRKFTGATPMYELMKAAAEKSNPPVNFSKLYPSAAATVTVGYQVPGSFTVGGYAFMQQAFKEVDKYFASEAWVMGDLQATSGEKFKVVEAVRTLYRNDFILNWKRFLASARVAGYSGPKDAAQKLAALSSQASPLLQLFYTVSKNTAVDSVAAATVFQPVQLLTPPGSPDKLIGDASKQYMDNLLALQGALEAVSSAPAGQTDAAAQTAIAAATAARTSARAAAQGFTSDPNSISQDVQRLMLAPPSGVDPVLSGFGAAGLNKSGSGYCAQFEKLMQSLPFKPGATAQADLAEVSSLYAAGTGAIWTFYNDVGSKVLVQQGTRYAAKPSGDPKADPGFVDWFNRHSAFSRTLWKEGQPDPRLDFTLRPILSDQITLVTLSVGGQSRTWSRTNNAALPFKWVAAESPEVKLTVRVGGNEVVQDYKGNWGLFQLFQSASSWRQEGIGQKAQWNVTHQGQSVPVPFELTLSATDAPLIFQRDYFPRCGRIAR
jgi:type VI secretion system protein ImpL